MKNSARDLLASYVDALYPIIYIDHFDFKVIDEIIADISQSRKVIEFNNGLGIIDFKTKAISNECDLFQFLKLVMDDGYDDSMYIVLKDIHQQLDNPEIISLLKYIAERNLYNDDYHATIFIVSSKLVIPEELEDLITVFDMPVPTVKEISEIMTVFKNDLCIDMSEDVLNEIAFSFKGLNEFQIKQILNLAYQDGGCIDSDDKQLILRQKEQLIKKAGLLEMIIIDETIEDIGGLENLKEWLYRKELIFSQLDKAVKCGVDVPKGIMIVGMPGCGKSLAAKASAKLFDIPLVRLDVGRLMGKYIGESEENMRKALRLSEAISPCVLWIDEIEKAFSGVGGTGGGSDVTTRLFGQFLTWMQEKENTVFIVATANDISKIPPEFLRKGRFDELFYVTFPNDEERRKIIEIHLKKRNKWNRDLDIITIVKVTDGYNGADLEAIVKDAIESCFIDGRDLLTTDDLKTAQQNIKSISSTLQQRIKEIQESVKEIDLKPASRNDGSRAVRPSRKIRNIDGERDKHTEKIDNESNRAKNFEKLKKGNAGTTKETKNNFEDLETIRKKLKRIITRSEWRTKLNDENSYCDDDIIYEEIVHIETERLLIGDRISHLEKVKKVLGEAEFAADFENIEEIRGIGSQIDELLGRQKRLENKIKIDKKEYLKNNSTNIISSRSFFKGLSK
ncbi:AAA family ATPase [uncultured Acetobacterium sp.]|uniref:AAA family ATPase n=1 Tax=uncultured Acetobacterium sp. TaxID=217139 RepID=UPI0025E83F99|nr:AAA family ATPase [uncultured Acetobacterium sp.]